MALPSRHREEIVALARRWDALTAVGLRGEKINRVATGLIVACGGGLILFTDFITRASPAWTVVIPTAGFMWAGWYKMYRVGRNRRELKEASLKIDEELEPLCGEDAHFEGDTAEIMIGEQKFDPFSDGGYE